MALEPDAVRLMTIHAAKGLEFPVVCVADLGRTGQGLTPDLLLDGERVGLRLASLDGSPSRGCLRYEELCAERRLAEAAEEERIVYVAMTRARERLLLSGAVDFATLARRASRRRTDRVACPRARRGGARERPHPRARRARLDDRCAPGGSAGHSRRSSLRVSHTLLVECAPDRRRGPAHRALAPHRRYPGRDRRGYAREMRPRPPAETPPGRVAADPASAGREGDGARETVADASLFARAREHDDTRAREQLIERYLPLARRLARRYQRAEEPLEDPCRSPASA